MKHIAIDSYGKCNNNKQVDPNLPWKIDVLRKYKFTIAFESVTFPLSLLIVIPLLFDRNSNCDDYVTEKIYDALLAGTFIS